MRTGRTLSTLALALLFALTACGDDGDSVSGPSDGTGGQDGQASVAGRVEGGGSGSANAAASVRTQTIAGEAETAAVARVRSDGSLETVAEADVGADGRFTVDGVPAGEGDLVVVARGSDDAELGRVIVQETTRADATVTVAPINAETSVEGETFARLRADGSGAAADNSGGLALFVRMEPQVAAATAGSGARVQAMADAFVEGEAALSEVFASTGSSLDASSRTDVLVDLAARFAEERDQGASMDAAHRAFVEASVDSLHALGVTRAQTVMATAGQATVAGAATSGSDAAVHLSVVRHLARVNLAARTRAAEEIQASGSGLTAASAGAAAQAMADARADVGASASIDELRARTRAASDSAQAAVTAEVLEAASGLDAVALAQLESQLQTAFAEADLAARLEGETSASGVAQAAADHRSQVRAAVDGILTLLPSEVSLDAEAATSLLIAAGGGGAVQ